MIAVPTLRVSVTVAIPLTDSAVPTIFPTVISGELIKPFAFVDVDIVPVTPVSYTHLTLPTKA